MQTMKLISKSLLCLFAAAVISMFTTISPTDIQIKTNLTNVRYGANPISPIHSSLIRIFYGDFACSAVVIDAHYALTAAHCILNTYGFMTDEVLKIYPEDLSGYIKGYTGEVAAVDKNRDVALIRGDFNDFKRTYADFNGTYIENYNSGIDYIACGFAAAGNKFCSTFYILNNKYFFLKGIGGYMYKGMSGGPLYAEEHVIGINSAVDGEGTVFGPLLGIDVLFGID